MGWQKNILMLSLLAAVIALPVSATVCHLALVIYILCWMSEGRWGQKFELLCGNPIIIVYLLFLVLHVIGITYSEDVANGWFNVEKKLFFFLLPAFFGTTLNLDRKDIQLLFKGFIASCFLATLFCLAMALVHFLSSDVQNNFDTATLALFRQLNPEEGGLWMYFSYIALASGVGIHPTFLALYLIFCIFLLTHLYAGSFKAFRPIKKASIIFLFLYFETLIVLLSSRIVILSLIVIIFGALFGLDEIKHLPVARRALIASVLILPLLLILSINPVSKYRSIQEPSTMETYSPSSDGVFEYSTGIRKSLWQLSIHSILDENLIIGVGTGDVKNVMRKKGDEAGQYNIIGSWDPHNQFLYTQLGLGMVGLAALAACFYFPAWLALRQKNFFYLAFILIITFICFTESMIESQKGIVFFAIFNSLLVFPYYNLYATSQQRIVYG